MLSSAPMYEVKMCQISSNNVWLHELAIISWCIKHTSVSQCQTLLKKIKNENKLRKTSCLHFALLCDINWYQVHYISLIIWLSLVRLSMAITGHHLDNPGHTWTDLDKCQVPLNLLQSNDEGVQLAYTCIILHTLSDISWT